MTINGVTFRDDDLHHVAMPVPLQPLAVAGLGRTEAETLTIDAGFVLSAIGAASGGFALGAGDSGVQRASAMFDGPEGVYAMKVGYFDESDGVSRMDLRVNDVAVAAWSWSSRLGAVTAGSASRAEHAVVGVRLTPGDRVGIAGLADGGEPLRTDWIEIIALPEIGPGRVEAEALAIVSGFRAQTGGIASGAAYLQADGRGESRAAMAFAGEAGRYDLTLGYFDESDGASAMAVLVNGAVVAGWAWDEGTASPLAGRASRAERTLSGLDLAPGDVIELRGRADGGEPLRTDWLEIAAAAPPPPPPPALDLLIEIGGALHVLINDGAGHLAPTPAPITLQPRNSFLSGPTFAMGDLDGDGRPDIVRGVGERGYEVLLGDGAGGFAFTSAGELPPPPPDIAHYWIGPIETMALVDLDGDDDLDLVAFHADTAVVGVALNDGVGRLTPYFSMFIGDSTGSNSFGFGDFDGDGDPDIVANIPAFDGFKVLLNDGSGAFGSFGPYIDSSSENAEGVKVADLNADGLPDVFTEGVADEDPLIVMNVSLGQGRYGITGYLLDPDRGVQFSGDVAVADFNGDGRADLGLVIRRADGVTTDIWLNRPSDGGGEETFFDERFGFVHVFEGSSLPGRPRFADMDGDGDLDALLLTDAEDGLAVRAFLNDGAGRFEETAPLTVAGLALSGIINYTFAEVDTLLSPWSVIDVSDTYL